MVKDNINYEDMITVALSREECRVITSIISGFAFLYSKIRKTLTKTKRIYFDKNMAQLEPLLKKFSFEELTDENEDRDKYEQERFDTDVCL